MSYVISRSVGRCLTGIAGVLLVSLAAGVRADGIEPLPVTPLPPLSTRIEQKMQPRSAPPVQIAALPPALLTSGALAAAKTKQVNPLSIASKIVPIAIRLGTVISPRSKFVGGIDFTIPFLRVGGFYTRIDAEAIVSANFRGVSTLFPVTVNAVTAKSLPAGGLIYAGAGVGPYFGDVTRFGGKLLIGGDFNKIIGAELNVHFIGAGDPVITVMARIGL